MPAAKETEHVTSSERVTCVFVKQIVAFTCTHCNFSTRNCNCLTLDTYQRLYAYRGPGNGRKALSLRSKGCREMTEFMINHTVNSAS